MIIAMVIGITSSSEVPSVFISRQKSACLQLRIRLQYCAITCRKTRVNNDLTRNIRKISPITITVSPAVFAFAIVNRRFAFALATIHLAVSFSSESITPHSSDLRTSWPSETS